MPMYILKMDKSRCINGYILYSKKNRMFDIKEFCIGLRKLCQVQKILKGMSMSTY